MARGDVDAALALVDSEVEWTPTVWSGSSARGRERVREWMLQFGDDLEHLRVNLEAVEPSNGRVLALGTVFDRRGDHAFATRAGWIFEVAGGLVGRARAFSTWEDARIAAGGA
ncbi:MAG: hypothetical protein QOI10_2135 [Solirubrobacterales bacterium]|jgi:ketosteroid isomerase-like protein|nr:hypothetical protein [Solirubrobacterales bacterium]